MDVIQHYLQRTWPSWVVMVLILFYVPHYHSSGLALHLMQFSAMILWIGLSYETVKHLQIAKYGYWINFNGHESNFH